MPFERLRPEGKTSTRPYSPYRKEDLIVVLPEEGEHWDPVMKVEYLTALEETALAQSLILETRRQAIQSDPISVDIRNRSDGMPA